MDDEFHDLHRLLRLKSHEAPPPAYHEDFMREFHWRQRGELLRRPLWRLALDRLEAALPTFTPVRYAYAGACATAVVAASLVSTRILTAPTPNIASVTPSAWAADTRVALSKVNIYSDKPSLRFAPDLNFDDARRVSSNQVAANRTRYVLDASPVQPVVYAQRSDF